MCKHISGGLSSTPTGGLPSASKYPVYYTGAHSHGHGGVRAHSDPTLLECEWYWGDITRYHV